MTGAAEKDDPSTSPKRRSSVSHWQSPVVFRTKCGGVGTVGAFSPRFFFERVSKVAYPSRPNKEGRRLRFHPLEEIPTTLNEVSSLKRGFHP